MPDETNPLLYISGVQELLDTCAFLEDTDLKECIDKALHVIVKPNMKAETAATLVVQLYAFAFKFELMYSTYMTIKKGTKDAAMKKNLYKSAQNACTGLADALKYIAKTGYSH